LLRTEKEKQKGHISEYIITHVVDKILQTSQVNLFIEHYINTTFVDPKCFTDGEIS